MLNVLEMIADNDQKMVASMDEIDRVRSGIRKFHVKDFLLMEKW